MVLSMYLKTTDWLKIKIMIKVNIDKIITIDVRLKELCDEYEYQKEIKILGITFQKEGFNAKYENISGHCYKSRESILENDKLYIENNIVYYRPFIKFKLANNDILYKHFPNIGALHHFLISDVNLSKLNLLDI